MLSEDGDEDEEESGERDTPSLMPYTRCAMPSSGIESNINRDIAGDDRPDRVDRNESV